MDDDRAKQLLANDLHYDGENGLGHLGAWIRIIHCADGHAIAEIDGQLTADELEALAMALRNPRLLTLRSA